MPQPYKPPSRPPFSKWEAVRHEDLLHRPVRSTAATLASVSNAEYAPPRSRVQDAGLGGRDALQLPPAATNEELLRAHDFEYLERVTTGQLTAIEQKRIGFPWSPQMVERSRRSSGATLAACRAALNEGVAVNLAGGTITPSAVMARAIACSTTAPSQRFRSSPKRK